MRYVEVMNWIRLGQGNDYCIAPENELINNTINRPLCYVTMETT
jgi:hypothetical protein